MPKKNCVNFSLVTVLRELRDIFPKIRNFEFNKGISHIGLKIYIARVDFWLLINQLNKWPIGEDLRVFKFYVLNKQIPKQILNRRYPFTPEVDWTWF